MSNMTLIDSHVHLWDTARLDYPWLTDVPAIANPHLPSDYREASSDYDVAKLVFVQCDVAHGQSRDEVRWISELAETDEPRIAGIVAWAPVANGAAVAPELEWLATMPLVRGVRQLIQPEADNAFCAKPDFVRGVQLLGQAGLSFDLCIKGDEQFVSVLALVEQCPDVRFVLDHIGKPFIAEGIVEPWAGYIGQLAQAPNVFCKISGVTTEADWKSWSPDSLRPYTDIVFEAFGFDRVMFGGDWPVVSLSSTWSGWVESLNERGAEIGEEERRRFFHDNAAAFYRL